MKGILYFENGLSGGLFYQISNAAEERKRTNDVYDCIWKEKKSIKIQFKICTVANVCFNDKFKFFEKHLYNFQEKFQLNEIQ